MRLYGWFRFPKVTRGLAPRRRNKTRPRFRAGWHVPAMESLETRTLLSVTLSVSNPAPLPEGDAGTSNMIFVVTRSGDPTADVTVDYTTVDGTAIAGVDYTATSGTLDFTPGVTTLPVNVPVIGNTIFQPVRTFSLQLGNPVEAPGLPSFAAPQTFATGSAPISMSFADINGGGLKDLIVVNEGSNSVSVLLNTTTPGSQTASFAAQQTFATPGAPRGVVVADINGDGRPDLIVSSGSQDATSVEVLLNTTAAGSTTANFAAGQFFFATATQTPSNLTLADLNGDGRQDLIVGLSNTNEVAVLLNTTAPGSTTASFAAQQTFATGVKPYSVTAADINGDGRNDLIVTNNGSASVSVLLNTTAPGATLPSFEGQQTFATGSNPRGVTTADINGDGLKDIIVANYLSNSISVLLNSTAPGSTQSNFAAQQTFAAGAGPFSLTAADLNGDGKLDLLVSKFGASAAAVLFNDTTPGSSTAAFATASTFAAGGNSTSAIATDLNGDGTVDLAVTNISANTVSVLLSTTTVSSTINLAPKTTFAVPASTETVKVADFNGDGKPDLVVTNSNSEIGVLLNTTTPGATAPTFSPLQTFATFNHVTVAEVADINGDGRPDVIVSGYGPNEAGVLLNTTAPGAAVASFSAQQTFATGVHPLGLTAADLNGDGLPDLIAVNYVSNSVSVLLNTTSPGASIASFAAQSTFATGNNPIAVTVADINGDGRKDLIVDNYAANTVSVLMNTTGPGATVPSFASQVTFATGTKPDRLSTADINGDGRLDLIIPNVNSNSVSVLLNTTAPGATTPSFAAQQTFATINPNSVTAVDLNGDGKPDILVSNVDFNTQGASVLVNTTAPGATTVAFAAAQSLTAGGYSFSAAAADFNGDGRPDVVVDNESALTVSVLLNTPLSQVVAVNGSPATGTIQDDDAPFTLAPVGGDGQTATINSPFGKNLSVLVKNAAGQPVSNVGVMFSAPALGASGFFGNLPSVTIVTNASGIATAPTFTANGTVGASYAVTATAVGGASPSGTFSLQNTATTAAPLFGSATSTVFAVGLAGSLTVKATGTPAPTLSENNTDVLPSGVTFNPATGVLGGKPAANTQGVYVLHFSAANAVTTVQQTFTLNVTSPFSFTGEYAVFTGNGSPTLASITQTGNQLALKGASMVAATITDATKILVNGTDFANYGNGSITFLVGTFAGQTWTKLDLPADYTNSRGAATHIIQNGAALTFVDSIGGMSPGQWINATQVFATAWNESATIAVGKLLWQDGSIWSENLVLHGTKNGSGITTIAAAPSQVYVFDYVNAANKPVHLVQTGTTNVIFIDSLGHMALGIFISPTQATTPYYPNDIATISLNAATVSWQDGSLWTKTAPTAAITVTNYTNAFGVPVHLIQNGTSQLAFVDSLGRTSLGVLLNPTTAQTDLYGPGDLATISANTVSWQDGSLWTKTNVVPLTITLTDTNGAVSHVKLTSPTTLIGLDRALQGLTATRLNDKLFWSNGAVWDNLDLDLLNALFELGTGYP